MQSPTPTPDVDPALLKRPLLYYASKWGKQFRLGIFFLILTDFLDVLAPLLLARGIDQISNQAPLREVFFTAILLLVLMAALAACRYLWRIYFGEYHTRASEDLRGKSFARMLRLGRSYWPATNTGEAVSLLVSDVQSFRGAIGNGLLVFVDSVVLIAFIVPAMLYLQPTWTWQSLVLLPLVPFLVAKILRGIFTRHLHQQQVQASLTGFIQESVNGVRLIKGFSNESDRQQQYQRKNLELEAATRRTNWLDSWVDPCMMLGTFFGTAILVAVAAPDLISGAATVGSFVAFQRYLSKMAWPMTGLGIGFSQYKKGMASFERLRELLELQNPRMEKLDAPQLNSIQKVELKELTYTYKGSSTNALEGIDFNLPLGKLTLVLGATGSGKSTLLEVLAQTLQPSQGRYLLNDRDAESWDLASFRRKICLVTQTPVLFSTTVGENINYLANCSPEQLRRLMSQAQLDQDLAQWKDAEHTQLGEKGINLSGGQRQRVSLARGLSHPGQILLLDDVLSAVDQVTEERILQELKKLKQTTVLVTHRVTSARLADWILVLDHGQKVFEGPYSDHFFNDTAQWLKPKNTPPGVEVDAL